MINKIYNLNCLYILKFKIIKDMKYIDNYEIKKVYKLYFLFIPNFMILFMFNKI